MKRITGRSWAFVMYPESMPDNYEEIILNTGLPMAISPLHNQDLEPTGESKKPHYHVIVYYENATTYNNVKTNVTDKLNATFPIKLESMRGMYRYHIHLDNPEKHQYDDRERKFYNGFDIDMAQKLTKTEKNKLIREIHNIICDMKIYEYCDLMDYLKACDMLNLYEVAQESTIYFNAYIKSRKYSKKEREQNIMLTKN